MQQRTSGAGIGLALLSAATFGTSGTFARSLTDAGWSSGAAVAIRVGIAAVLLAIPGAIALRGRWPVLKRNLGMTTVYGLVAVAGCQVFFFNAVQTLSVGVALLLEYLGTVLVVLWMWLRHGDRPRKLTVAGSVAALIGLVLILNLTGDTRIDLVGVLWGLGAAVGLATFFVLSGNSDPELPPVAFASVGMGIGALSLLAVGAIGVLPMHATFGTVSFAGDRMSWLVPVIGLSLVAATIAYVTGISAARILGARLASFIGLTEVLAAVLFAWLMLDELPTSIQLAGGVLIVIGVALVKLAERDAPAATVGPEPVPEAELQPATVK